MSSSHRNNLELDEQILRQKQERISRKARQETRQRLSAITDPDDAADMGLLPRTRRLGKTRDVEFKTPTEQRKWRDKHWRNQMWKKRSTWRQQQHELAASFWSDEDNIPAQPKQ